MEKEQLMLIGFTESTRTFLSKTPQAFQSKTEENLLGKRLGD